MQDNDEDWFEIVEYVGERYRVTLTITGAIYLEKAIWQHLCRLTEGADGLTIERQYGFCDERAQAIVALGHEHYEQVRTKTAQINDPVLGSVELLYWETSDEQATQYGVTAGRGISFYREEWEQRRSVGVLHDDPDNPQIHDTTLVHHLRERVLKAARKLSASDRVLGDLA